MSATQSGVEESIHDRLMAKMAPSEPSEPIAAPEESADVDLEAQAEEVEATEETTETVEVTEVEESVEAEPSEIEAQEQEPSDTQEIELSHIAEYLGANEDQFIVSDDGDLMVKTKIDGKEGQAKFSDLLKSYQLEGHLNKQSTEVAETQKALQSKLAEADGQLAQKVQQLEDLSQLAYNELLSDFNKVNWDELRADDPAEWSAKQTDFQNRQSQIANLYQKAQDQRGELAATDEVSPEKIAEEKAALLQAFPEWSDDAKHQKGWVEIGEYAMTKGYTSEEYQSTADHRLIVMMDKARQFDALNKESSKVTKLVRKAPKIAKPGSTAAKIPSKQAEAEKLRKQLKRDGGGSALHELLLKKV